ncbi:MAG: GNAT family N-acetyltransferase [Acidimicrobiia bacterium]
MSPRIAYRQAGAEDTRFLTEMLAEAVAWQPNAIPSVDGVLANPFFAHYVIGWPRIGDHGIIALDGSDPIGAAWYRHFTDSDRGFGFVAPSIPELSIAVVSGRRQRGVGRGLLRELLHAAAMNDCAQISLSVEPENPARHLYESLGFRVVGTDGGACTMLAETTSN